LFIRKQFSLQRLSQELFACTKFDIIKKVRSSDTFEIPSQILGLNVFYQLLAKINIFDFQKKRASSSPFFDRMIFTSYVIEDSNIKHFHD